MSNGKGSRPRPVNHARFAANWETIDWSKGRPPARERKPTVGEILVKDYATKADWVIPPLSEILGPAAYGSRLFDGAFDKR